MDFNVSRNETIANKSVNINGSTAVTGISWSFPSISDMVIFPSIVIFNGSVLFIFIYQGLLSRPFYIYLANLLFANLVFAIMNNPLDILNLIYPSWWLGNTACTVYLYSMYVVDGIMMHAHVLIAINRVWAVTFHISYTRRNTVRTALYCCLASCIYVHAVCLPYVVLDALYYRLPIETAGCLINTEALQFWSLLTQFLIYTLPIVFIVAVYPYLVYKRRARRIAANIVAPETDQTPASEKVEAGTVEVLPKNGTYNAKGGKRGFRVLTALTFSVTLLWTPSCIFFNVNCFIDISDQTLLMQIVLVMFASEAVLDPLLFALVLDDVRDFIVGLVRALFKSA
ncbi:5-hydroxytryptamine receptor 1D-like [Paramacrobiotus metropolitanus]|uniref:5-hydroxytryptamine receptor 1D-like n=1 Tax=Paramacrobiotus metropolitanus TaxID=2943436 RepID=UPI002445EDA8|nr:5-hydroxytryptamine receptor 1D-like [Paramacrobiotus metropolitanus]